MIMTEDNRIVILITRYLSGEATIEELKELKEWTERSKDNRMIFQNYKNIWDSSGNSEKEKMINAEKSFNLIKKRIAFKSPAKNLWQYWKNIAAVLLVPLIAGNILYYLLRTDSSTLATEPVYNEIFAAFGTRSEIKLSDGSSLWLNSGSSIKYPDRFTGDERTVYLNGEAYFEVESNPKKPFIVETSSVRVRATGTKFNVSGYDYDKESEVTLVSGKVEVCMTDDNNNFNKSELNVNQHLLFNSAAGTTIIKTVDVYKYIAWKDGKLIFRDEPLSSVVKKIGQIFNVEIELTGKEIQNYSYRATFEEESLEEILKLLKISSPIDYMEIKRAPLPDNSFPRKKVIIYESGKKPV
jgi:ferric-dicitrate binding protein FerR (iron transport regulator)